MTIAVQITHVPWLPDRRANVTRMVRQIKAWAPEVPVGVSEDKGWRDVWQTVRLAMMRQSKTPTDHLLILADDFRFHHRSFSELQRAVDSRPDQLIQPFAIRSQFIGAPEAWGVTDMVWGSALLWPVELIPDFLRWVQEFVDPAYPGDDMRVRAWLAYHRRSNYLTNPSLFDHMDREFPSVIGNRTPLPRVARTVRRPYGAVEWDETQVF